MSGAALRQTGLEVLPEDDRADCCWQYFRTVGSTRQVDDSLRRLHEQGWQVLSDPEPGPFDTWTVRVRHPRRCLHAGQTLVASSPDRI